MMAEFQTESRLQFSSFFVVCYDCQRCYRFCIKSLSTLISVKFDYDHVATTIATVGDTVDFILT
jgi:hypothetical protein